VSDIYADKIRIPCRKTTQSLPTAMMEIESIAVICLVILVVLIIQIMVTLRLLLYFHHRSHEKDEEHALSTMIPSTTVPPAAATQLFPGSLRTHPRPLPTPTPAPQPAVSGHRYASSSIYSVPTVVINTRDEEHSVHLPRPSTNSSSRERIPRAGSSDYDAHSESSTPIQRMSEETKEGIFEKVWGKKSRSVKDAPNVQDSDWS
jgi:hypothetical protein